MATAAEARTLQNYIAGQWRDAATSDALEDRDPATGELSRPGAAVRARPTSTPPCRPPAPPSPPGARCPPQERARAVLALRDALIRHRPGAHRAGHRRHGQDARRRRRRGRPRHRVGRVGGRDPSPAQGRDARGGRHRPRRRAGPPARRRGRGDHPVQLPGDDPALVPALRGRLRKRLRAEALGAGPAAPPSGSAS